MEVKLVTMVDLESNTASLKVLVKTDEPVHISFQGETRLGKPENGVVTEDFYVLCISLWGGLEKGNLYSVEVEGENYTFGFRTVGLDSMRGFFLNASSYPLKKENAKLYEKAEECRLLEDDRSGFASFVAITEPEEVEKYYNHPSVLGWILPSGLAPEELKAFQKRCFVLDKTRPSALLLDKDYPLDEPLLRIPDILFFSPLSGGLEKASAYHKAYPYRCVGTLPGRGDNDTRYLILR